MNPILAVIRRDLLLARRAGGGGALGVSFFLCLVTIVPFAIGPDLNLLARIGPAVLWIATLLSVLLGLDRLFQADREDGSLDQFGLSDTPLELIVLAKCAAHWLTTTLPLILCTPLFGLMLALDGRTLVNLILSLLAGTPGLVLTGAIGAALTVSLRRGGLLLSVLVVPLAVPVLIFGVAAATAASGTVPFLTPFCIEVGLSLAAAVLAPFAAAAALKAAEQ